VKRSGRCDNSRKYAGTNPEATPEWVALVEWLVRLVCFLGLHAPSLLSQVGGHQAVRQRKDACRVGAHAPTDANVSVYLNVQTQADTGVFIAVFPSNHKTH
jgi:hypothetical protein